MKIAQLLIALLLTFPGLSDAADDTVLPAPVRSQIETQAREMSAMGADYEDARKMLTTMHRNQFSDETIARARQTVMQCAKAALPTEPVMNKAMEGMAKQAREAQIIAAMQAVRSRYTTASRMAKTLSNNKAHTTAMTHSIADSLAAGDDGQGYGNPDYPAKDPVPTTDTKPGRTAGLANHADYPHHGKTEDSF